MLKFCCIQNYVKKKLNKLIVLWSCKIKYVLYDTLQMESKLRGMYGEDFVVLAVSLPEDSVAKSRKTRSLMAVSSLFI